MFKVPPPPTEDPPEGWQSRPKPRTHHHILENRVKLLEHDFDIIKTRMPGLFNPNPKRNKSVLSTLKEEDEEGDVSRGSNEEFGGKLKRGKSKRGKSKRDKSKRGKPFRKKLTRKKSKRLSRKRR